jgi:acetate kinase
VQGLEFLGIVVDPEKNVHPLPFDNGLISIGTDDSPTHLLVIRTDEELMIARETVEVLS